MPLVQNELVIAPRTIARRVARGALLLVTTTLAGVVVLAAAAYASRDTTRGVPSPPQLVVADAGPPAVKAEPQVPPDDVLAIVTVATEPDAGSPFVAAPPVDAQAVASLVSAVAQSCLIDALRFDPAIGGTIVVTVTLAAAGSDSDHSTTLDTKMAPVFSRCFSARARALTLPTTSWPDPLRDVVTLSLDGLRNVAVVQSSELAFGP